MLELKLAGCALVLLAGTHTGFSAAAKCGRRTETLRQLQSVLVALRSYMDGLSLPLDECLLRCAGGANGKVRSFLTAVAERLMRDYTVTPAQAMRLSLREWRDELALDSADCETLIVLGNNLGLLDKQEQDRCLLMTERQLAVLEREAAEYRDKNSKMYRYLGICASLMVILLLI